MHIDTRIFAARRSHRAGRSFGRTALCTAVLGLCTAAPATAASVNWTGVSGFWDLVANWNSNPALPGVGDSAVIDVAGVRTITVRATGGPFLVDSLTLPGDDLLAIAGGSLTLAAGFTNNAGTSITSGSLNLNGASSMASLTQSAAGVLGGIGLLTVGGTASLSGTHTGIGSTILQGATTISGLNLDAGRVLLNQNTVTLNGGMNLNPANNTGAGRIDNAIGALFDVRTFNLSIAASGLADLNALPGYPVFNNAGELRKSTSGGYGISVPLNNTGKIDVQLGSLSLNAGGNNSGSNTIAAGSSLILAAGVHDLLAGASFTGAGALTVSGAGTVVNIVAPTTVGSAFTMGGGTVQGGNLTLTGATNIAISSSLGMMSGAGTTFLQGATSIANFSLDAGRVLRNEATTNLVGSIDLNRTAAAGAGRIENAAGALFDVRTFNHGISSTNQGAADNGLDAAVNNAGIWRKSASANNYGISVRFNNLAGGVVDVQTGGFTFSGGGSHRGAAMLATGTSLALGGGTHDIHAGASFSGAGTLAVNGAATVVNIDTPLTIASGFSQSGGTIQGSDLTLSGPTALGIVSSLGHMTGASTTTLQGATRIGGVNAFGLDAKRVLRNEGDLMLVGAIQMNRTDAIGAGRIENTTSGVVDVQTFNLSISSADQGVLDRGLDARFDNAGLFKKTSTGNYTIAVPFFNTGIVSVEKGSLTFSGGIAGQFGRIVVGAGTALGHAGVLDNRGVLQGAGTISASTVSNSGRVSPGLSPGRLTIAGNYAQRADGDLEVELENLSSFDLLSATGGASLAGTLTVRPFGGYLPVVGDSFVILASGGTLSGAFDGSPIAAGFGADVDFEVSYDYSLRTVTLQVAQITAVPEPAAGWLLLAGLGGVACAAGWRKRRLSPIFPRLPWVALAGMLLTVAPAWSRTLDAQALKDFGGTYSVDCANPNSAKVSVFANALVFLNGNQRIASNSIETGFAFFHPNPGPPGFRVSLINTGPAGQEMLWHVFQDGAGPYLVFEQGDARTTAAIGAALAKQKFRRCGGDAPAHAMAQPPAAVPLPASPKRVYALHELSAPGMLQDPKARAAYFRALGPLRREPWLARLDGPSGTNRQINVAGAPYLLASACKNHDCFDHNTVLLYSAEQGLLVGLVYQRGRAVLIGAPSPALAGELGRLWRQEYRSNKP